ncbi:MAG TPA: hypothetical protein VFX49_15935 [Chloroflexota bacterium]|nr:hypothetical protein [Chloroflexota bacterium]
MPGWQLWQEARYCMRREELSRLNRTDVQDGRSQEGLVTGKGNKDRLVFFDDAALESIRTYLAARGDTFSPYIYAARRWTWETWHAGRALAAVAAVGVGCGEEVRRSTRSTPPAGCARPSTGSVSRRKT